MNAKLLICALALALGLPAVSLAQDKTPRRPTPPARPTRPDLSNGRAVRVALEISYGRTDWGKIILELAPDKAPQTVANFLSHVEAGFYDGTIFHRVIPDFLIQGGGYTRIDAEKPAGARTPVPNEAKTCGLKNTRGTIAMARAKDPHSATTQFFINVKDNPGLDPECTEGDGWGYCVFGRVVEGMDVVDRIKVISTKPHPRLHSERSVPIGSPPTIKRAYRTGPDGKPLGQPEPRPTPHERPGERRGERPTGRPEPPHPTPPDPGTEPPPQMEPEPLPEPVPMPEPEPTPEPEPEPLPEPTPEPEPQPEPEPAPEYDALPRC